MTHLLSRDGLNPALESEGVTVMNFLNEIAGEYPDAISFAPGRPPEELFGVPETIALLGDFVDRGNDGRYARLGQYGRTNGIISDLIARLLKEDEGIEVEPPDIVVTVGAQEAMLVCLQTLCSRPGDVLLVAEPLYIGISGAAQVLGVDVVPVQSDEGGIDLPSLELVCATLEREGKRARLLYVCPDFANPTGSTMGLDRRTDLLALTRLRGLLVIEDHAYNYFVYDGERLPPLKALPFSGHVIYLGSFSKSIFPGLRVGFIAAGQRVASAREGCESLADEMSKVKSLTTVNTSPLCQAIVGGLLLRHGCSLREYTRPKREALKARRDAITAALDRHFRSGIRSAVTWNSPAGGFFLRLELPFVAGPSELKVSAADFGVLWTPMSYFYLQPKVGREIRLSFSAVSPEQIDEGVRRLAAFVQSNGERGPPGRAESQRGGANATAGRATDASGRSRAVVGPLN